MQVRKSPLMNLVVYLMVIVLALIGLVVLPDPLTKAIALVLFAAFGLGYTFMFARADKPRVFVYYFVLQALLVTILIRLFDRNDAANLLFFILGVQVMLVFPLRAAAAWLVLFYLITAANALWARGVGGIVGVLFNAAVFAFIAAYGYTLRQVELARSENQKLVQELREAQSQMRELAIAQERNRLARDLHDSVKQHIFAASMQLGATRATLDDPPTARAHLDETERLVHQAQQELNTLIFELRPIALGEQSLATALREYVRTWSRASSIAPQVEVLGERALPSATEQALFRVAQETLANIARHSGANQVQVQLEYAPTETRMCIEDNGRGFQVTENFRGIGLDSMHERMTAIGGALEIDSELGQGTRVTATVPERTAR